MFKENGVTNGSDAQSIAPQKLQEILVQMLLYTFELKNMALNIK